MTSTKLSKEVVEDIFYNYKRRCKGLELKTFNEFPIRSGRFIRYCKNCEYAKHVFECGRTYKRSNYSAHIRSKLL